MKRRALVTGTSVRQEILKSMASDDIDVIYPRRSLTEAEFKELLSSVDALLLGGDETLGSDLIKAADRLKIVAFLGSGYANFMDVPALEERNIHISNTWLASQ